MVFKNFIFRINDVTFAKVYSKLLAYESKLKDYNTLVVINIGDNCVNLSNCVNNVVISSSTINSNRISANMSIGDFGDINSCNAAFVERNTNKFSSISLSNLARKFSNMYINPQQPNSYIT